jgi:predicted ATP-dependent endonuclease of OLD family
MDNKETAKYIERIEIKGLWGRYDVDWKLNPDVNILVGENGTGKSTILKILEKYLTSIKHKIEHSEISGNYKTSDIFGSFDNKKIVKAAVFNHSVLMPELGGAYYYKIGKDSLDFNTVYQLDIVRTFDIDKPDDEYYRSIKNPLDIILREAIDRYVEYQLNLNKKIVNQHKDIDKVFFKWQFFITTVNSLFKSTEKSIDKDENRIAFRFNNDQNGLNKVYPNELSSGEKQLLIILLTVLCQDEKPSILLMDEPEISLHFTWQYELVKIIRELNPNCQVIIATHSVSIFAKGWMDKLFYMDGKEGEENVIRHKIPQMV